MTNQTNTSLFFPDLETERLLLRQLTFEDTEFVFKHFSDPQVTQYLMDEPPVADRDEARGIISFFMDPEGKRQNRWGLVRKSDQRMIGTIGFHRWEKAYHRCDIGYDLSPDCWGHGYMSEALKTVLHSGFDRMDLHRMDAYVYTGNPRSYGLLEKFGFKKEGLLRDYFFLNGSYYDHYLFGLLRRDWEVLQS
ncbi:MAG TPA: GNAT family protein [Longilinea sp.]|nr:GNAT family protein [Longilinea sp.]